jgi:hypothetical protein
MKAKFISTVLLVALALGVEQKIVAQTTTPSTPAETPANPVSAKTLRTYFEVCHTPLRNREALDQQFEKQRQALPPWYPPDVWNETVKSVEDIDIVDVALPIYQKYDSEELIQHAIHLFVTPEGQAAVKKVYDMELQHIASGDNAADAQRKALSEESSAEDATVRAMLHSLTPQQRQETAVFIKSPEWRRMNVLYAQIEQEFNAAYLARQHEVTQQVAERHKLQLQTVFRAYHAAHPGGDSNSSK